MSSAKDAIACILHPSIRMASLSYVGTGVLSFAVRALLIAKHSNDHADGHLVRLGAPSLSSPENSGPVILKIGAMGLGNVL